jgi:cellulose synthase operon protein C
MAALIRLKLRPAMLMLGALALVLLSGRMIMLFNDRSNAAEAFAMAKQYVAANKWRAARIELMNAVKDDPRLVDAYVLQAEVALRLFNGATARIALEKAIGGGVEQLQVQHLLGYALYQEGDFERAEGLLDSDEIPKKYKGYAYRILGKTLLAKGDVDAARNAFDSALKLEPKNSLLWTDVGAFRLSQADQKGAIEAADYAVQLDNRNIRAIELRGRLVRSQYGMTAALPWFEGGLTIDPNDVPLLQEYAITLGEVGRVRDMLKTARKIYTLDAKNSQAFYMQAVIAARAGDFALTQRILLLAGGQVNEIPGAMLVSAISEYQLGNYNKSADILERLVVQQPGNMRVRKLLARAKQSAGESFDALDAIKPLVDRGQADSYSAMVAARAFEANDERDKAAGGLSEASRVAIRKNVPISPALSLRMAADEAARNPGNARYAIPYIRALMLEGAPDKALLQAKKLQADNPGVADAHMIVGDVEMALGSYGAAAADFERARAINFSEGIMLRLVNAYRRANRGNDASKLLAEFSQFNPNNLSAQRLVAYLLLDQSRWSEAIPLLEKLRTRTGYNDSILNANIARAYSGANRHDDAIFNSEMAYRIDPANPMVTLVYAQVLLKSGKRSKATLELFEKADALLPGNKDVAAGLKAAKTSVKAPKAVKAKAS